MTIRKLMVIIMHKEKDTQELIQSIRNDMIDDARELALDPNSTISRLLSNKTIRDQRIDYINNNIDEDIRIFVNGYKVNFFCRLKLILLYNHRYLWIQFYVYALNVL